MKLTQATERYILHWGEMGTRWGVNRSVAQVHALLYLSPKPIPADEIVETLSIARSNVSTSLKELQGWGLVQLTHILGDRRDHFESKKDLWDLLLIIVEERKRREIDPTLTMLRECVAEAREDKEIDPEIRKRIQTTLEFVESMTSWYDQVKRIPKPTLVALVKLGDKIVRFIRK
jgi:DNA-binding transcriptional regulator GbsR (MarR family)